MPELENNPGTEQLLPPTAPVSDLKVAGLPERPFVSDDVLRDHAAHLATKMQQVQPAKRAADLDARLKKLLLRLAERLRACKALVTSQELTPTLEFLESGRMFEAVLTGLTASRRQFEKVPYVKVPDGAVPRVVNLAEEYIAAAEGIWSQESLALYIGVVQREDPLLLAEVLLLPGALKLAQLEFILDRADEAYAPSAGPMPSIEESPFSAPIHSMRRLNQFEWQLLLEQVVAFNGVLAEDPAGAYARMEEETRGTYRQRVAELAKDSDCSETELAQVVLKMTREAAARSGSNPRLTLRMSHVGYYLFEEGFEELSRRIGYHAPPKERLRSFLRKNNVDVYIFGIYVLSIGLIAAFIAPLVPHHEFLPVMGTLLLALLPATQGASDLVNNAVSAMLAPRALPKLDFAKGIPEEETTFVVVPTLLIHEAQIREMFEDLEARYLSNHDPHLHFGLLTDLPDSEERPQPEDRNSLVELAIHLTDELNGKYGAENAGCFLLLHRHRVFNTRQGVWMGWERKRGKLLDLNKLLLGEFDSFPLKAGPVHVLQKVRYVITLDSDTQLPRGTAARLIGAMAHPLNQAIVDPRRRIVTAGYGILQPRVGVSVSSASRSRLAALYSGETGYDIYTRAVSDVYQDLFGEGIFTGKGIYEVSTLHLVLDRRFPRNALLSHDLIEGAYARAGLATDIEVIDDYPSHYSAHTRRKHRWVRGDWQITQWLFSKVPDESGKSVSNPISTISRWKIFDNLRRSLIEPITFLLLVSGWLFLPGGALYWTLVTLALMLVPVFVQLGFNLGRAALKLSTAGAMDGFRTFFASLGFHLLTLVFIPHQTLLSLDAITRSLVRRFVTGKRLLEWETAAQAETGKSGSTLDLYLQLCPLVSFVLGGVVALVHYRALYVAGPILFLWALAPIIAGWLNSPPRKVAGALPAKEQRFLEEQALLIWRYFGEFGGAENHWLIPDNVEEKGLHQVRKLSPTNLGMLLNARQAALRLGFLTLPEFALATSETLATYDRLEKQRGHIYNWYDIETLRPIAPHIVSTVDSGNLAASFYALHGGTLELLKLPLLDMQSFVSLVRMLQRNERNSKAPSFQEDASLREAVAWLIQWQESEPAVLQANTSQESITGWQEQEMIRRRDALAAFVSTCTPWLLPQFTPLFGVLHFSDPDNAVIPTLERAVQYAHAMDSRLSELAASASDGSSERELAVALRTLMPDAIAGITQLDGSVHRILQESERHADAMRYDFLFVESRQLLSIGFDGQTQEIHSACYDLLASEARIASFLAVASGDIPQKAWFRLDRTHSLVKGRAALLSWTGTMFEYLMPTLWMRSFPDTLISRSLESSVAIQRQHVRGIPWGISESGFAKTDPQGRYGYQAWGIPELALKYGAEDGPIISPYSTFLALPFGREEALSNLHRMAGMGWIGGYGFYEAADYIDGGEPQMVRSWMAHHQGMSLLAITNLLCGNAFQNWFHANPKVRAAELLLHERPLSRQTLKSLETRTLSTESAKAE
ncbi:glucoamylase family protein [Granulicella sp. dw_53]|uniref:glucoamylase family protein n=1 Tax=Granulicella sp. dw_53 TaxID=2719792 RepID=UPI001BD4C4CA|nr:glucoamylase family protein [Granulicella sp. dw_53]